MRLLQAFAATSIPTGTMLLLLGMGSLGAAPRVPLAATTVEVQEEYWISLPGDGAPHLAEVASVDPLPEPATQSEENRPLPDAEQPALPEQTQADAETQPMQGERARAPGPTPKLGTSEPKPLPVHPGREARDARLAAQGKGGNKCLEPVAGIRSAGGNHWTVERSLLETYAKDREAASRLAVLTWEEGSDGQVSGFRIRRLRCGSPLHQAGFRNGDVVHAVNGKPITSYTEAAWAYGILRNEGRLRVKVTRRDGTAARLRYTLQ